jgi:thioredoxin-like negative regulator of GroEL
MSNDWDRQEIYRRAEEYRAKRKYKKAIKEYLQILAVDPEDIQVHNRMADVYHLLGEAEPAIEHYEKVAASFYKGDRLDKVIPICKQMLELEPRKLERYIDLGKLLVEKQWVADAIELYKSALKVFKGGRYQAERIKLFAAILKHRDNDYESRLELAKLYFKEHDDEKAEGLLQDGLEMMKVSRNRWQRKYRWWLFRLRPGWTRFWQVLSSTTS